MVRAIGVGLALALCAAPATAKERALPNSPLVAALANCQKIADGAARLACYDKAAPAIVAASNSGDIRVVDRESVRKARRSLFGFSLPSIPFFDNGTDRDAPPSKLDSTIVSFSSIGNGFYRFTIAAEGAVWESTEGGYVRDAKAGEPVTISRSKIGSYWAKIGNRRELRVRRIR
jgi:hypothetical protein